MAFFPPLVLAGMPGAPSATLDHEERGLDQTLGVVKGEAERELGP